IECSVMAMKYLGESFDMHLGGEDLIFPHHENEIAQSEALTGKPFVRFWVHIRFLLVEGKKMSKSLGNFYTLRDLILLGHKPSSIRYLLASVPYRRQLNFTFDGLKQAAASVERLRDFKLRLETGHFPEIGSPEFAELAKTGLQKMRTALEDDLNTAEALAAIFEMVRQANAAADAGKLGRNHVTQLQQALEEFDQIFNVVRDNDAEKIREIIEWAQVEGKEIKISVSGNHISDAQVEALVGERNAAKKLRDFARSDAIRKQLAEAGIILEDTKDGVRWKRQ
ncbi:MAG: cysteine--tRNA ligase, partial [Acidobacteria bacterium]